MKLSHRHQLVLTAALSVTSMIALGLLLGFKNPFTQPQKISIQYHFAGGIEEGSPVRVAGIKVGQVDEIQFFPDSAPGVPVVLKISVKEDAFKGIKEDSEFYINLAGLIGERYIEITPGSIDSKPLAKNATVKGIDPPRIDQIFSQGFKFAGNLNAFLERSAPKVEKTIQSVTQLSEGLNRAIIQLERSKAFNSNIGELIDNLRLISKDLRSVTKHADTEEGQKTLKLLHDLLWRLEPLDRKQVKKFLQEEGVKVNFL